MQKIHDFRSCSNCCFIGKSVRTSRRMKLGGIATQHQPRRRRGYDDFSRFTNDKLQQQKKMLQPKNPVYVRALRLWAFGIDTHLRFCFINVRRRRPLTWCCKLILDETLPLNYISIEQASQIAILVSIRLIWNWWCCCVSLRAIDGRVCKCYGFLTNRPLGQFAHSQFFR